MDEMQKALVTVGLPKTLEINSHWKQMFTGAAIMWLREKGYNPVTFVKYDGDFVVHVDSGVISAKNPGSYEYALALLVNLIKELK